MASNPKHPDLSILAAAPIGYARHEVVYDADGQPVDFRFLAVNPAFETLTGLRADELIGRRLLVLPS